MGSSSVIYKGRCALNSKASSKVVHHSPHETIAEKPNRVFSFFFQRRTKKNIPTKNLPEDIQTKEANPGASENNEIGSPLIEHYMNTKSFTLKSAELTPQEFKQKSTKYKKTPIAQHKPGEEETLGEIFNETLNSIKLKPEMAKIIQKKQRNEKNRNIIMMVKELKEQTEHFQRGVNGGELKINQKTTYLNEFDMLQKMGLKNDTSKGHFHDSRFYQMLSQKNSLSGENFEDVSKANERPEITEDHLLHVPQSRKTHITSFSKRMKTNENLEQNEYLKTCSEQPWHIKEQGTIKIHDKYSLIKLQRDLIQQKNKHMNSEAVTTPVKKIRTHTKRIVLIEDSYTNPNQDEDSIDSFIKRKRGCSSNCISPCKSFHTFAKTGSIFNSSDLSPLSPHKRTNTTISKGSSPMSNASPRHIRNRSNCCSPIMSPTFKIHKASILSSKASHI